MFLFRRCELWKEKRKIKKIKEIPVEKDRNEFWNRKISNIERKFNIPIGFNASRFEDDNEELKLAIINKLDSALMVSINWDILLKILAALGSMGGTIVSIILALR